MKKAISIILSVLIFAVAFTGCDKKPQSGTSDKPDASSKVEPTPEPTPTPPPYNPNVLTGKEKGVDYPEGQRITAVMLNNMSNTSSQQARPHRGISAADLVYEIVVEGGITRLMGVFLDYNTIPELGPVRSARDQYWQLIMPFQPLFVHQGQSVVQAQYIKDYDYQDLSIDGNIANITHRITSRPVSYDHTAFTSGEELAKYISNKGIDDKRTYNSTIFEFVNYNEAPRVLEGDEALKINIQHSQSYRTYFDYNTSLEKYEMSMYSGAKRAVEPTIDENNGVQLNFDNVLVLFTEISTYPGHEAKNLQFVDYNMNGVGYYFNGGRAEKIRWTKGSNAHNPLRITDGGGNEIPVQLNTGRTYVAVVDLDEYDNFSYTGPSSDKANSDLPSGTNSFVESE